jgi:molybdopterin synthase catalytic subunit
MDSEITFTNEPIDFAPSALPSHEIGALVEFHGIVRATEGADVVKGLSYEAYEPMARRQLAAHLRELGANYAVAKVVFVHRLGFVPVGEASLMVRVFSKHRGAALAVCGELIDRMKADVPIWKRG